MTSSSPRKVAILGGNRIYFDTGSASLDADSLGMIDRLAGVAIRCTTSAIEVAGHTDSDGDDQQNMALSQARAGAVVEALVRAGVARLEALGFRHVWLGTNAQNARANAFYERLGFEKIGARTFVVGGTRVEDDWVRLLTVE